MDEGGPIDASEATALRPSRSVHGEPLEEQRFTPGSVLAGRFRLVALLGRGGMGEVYRAEDLKLRQQVALKFLPAAVASRPGKLARLYSEVRLGRQVSHPNVCRLYDVMEWEGSHFISMEYIDGEDLASLLRRIGRLPHDKAVAVAHDICGGLAAAHRAGIVHRDLKPANIMIDGKGNARITDFGLAGLAEELAQIREAAGTRAYMAPEQSASGTATQRSDLYALGLILQEIFTGKRRAQAEEIEQIDPAVQRVIARCLEEKPEARPASIHAVIAALPSSDALQDAIDAGETPSPEMVAAAGEAGDLRPALAIAVLALMLVLLAGVAILSSHMTVHGLARFPKTPEALADRAKEILTMNGLPAARDSSFFVRYNKELIEHVKQSDHSTERWKRLRQQRPATIEFVYRQSPSLLVPIGVDGRVLSTDPPAVVPGMAEVTLDGEGRLVRFSVVPQRRDDTHRDPVAWERFFELAALDAKAFVPVEPSTVAPAGSDAQMAWSGANPDRPAERLRVEAASLLGLPVGFSVSGDWPRSSAAVPAEPTAPSARTPPTAVLVLRFVMIVVAAVLARRNIARGRGDRKGAFRTALVLFLLSVIGRIFGLHHVASIGIELDLLLERVLPIALTDAAITWLLYIAVEPYIRRFWPHALISWSRVTSGKLRDPRVGRDLLVGLIGGLTVATVNALSILSPTWVGRPPLAPVAASSSSLGELPHFASALFTNTAAAIRVSVGILSFLFLFLVLFRSRRVAAGMLLIFIAVLVTRRGESVPIEIAAGLITGAMVIFFLSRFGLLSVSAMIFVSMLLVTVPLTLDPSSWYFGRSLVGLTTIALLGGYGFYHSLAGRRLFEPLLEE